jgi:hypothetical protein
MTAFEVAEFIGCHEETVRRAYVDWKIITGLILEPSHVAAPRTRPNQVCSQSMRCVKLFFSMIDILETGVFLAADPCRDAPRHQ